MFCCWSGGKESVLSLYRVQKMGIHVRYLLNMVNSTGNMSRSHRIISPLVEAQAEALDVPLIQRRASWNTYEKEFKKVVKNLKRKGIRGGIFGDIDLQEHREWIERVCKELDVQLILPLWDEDRKVLLNDFIRSGFKAMVVVVKASVLDKEWLGRYIDEEFIKDIKSVKIDICGEKGEFHTFVYDGPVFKKPVEFVPGEKILRKGYWFLELCRNIYGN